MTEQSPMTAATPKWPRSRVVREKFAPWLILALSLSVTLWGWRFAAAQLIDRGEPLVVLALGLTISLLLFGIVRSIAGTQSRALALARAMTEELRESREEFRAVADTAMDAIVSADEHGRITYFNRGAERMFGYSAEEAGGRLLTALMPERFREAHRAAFQRFLATGRSLLIGQTLELTARHRDGREFPIELSLSTWTTTKGRFVTAILRDISARKAAEEALHKINESLEQRVKDRTAELDAAVQQLGQSRERLAGVVASAMDAIITVDESQQIVLFNAAAERMFGYREADLQGQPLERLIPDRFRAAHRGHIRFFGDTGVTSRKMGALGAISGLRANGEEFPVEASISQVHAAGRRFFTVIMRDVTERLRAEAEVRRLNEQLEQRVLERTAQLEAATRELEAFSYSVSHDLRAPLRHVHGFAKLLLERADGLDETIIRYLGIISKAAAKMGDLIDDLLALSRTGRAELRAEDVELNRLVSDVREECAQEAKGRSITWTVGDLPSVRGDAALLRIVLVNLLSNAVKFTAKRDDAVIEVGARGGENGEVVVYVKDNGAGFDSRYADKLFGVFQRLHREDEFEGTGIGLATVRRIVHRHGGRVWAEGEVDRGAAFYIALKGAPEPTDG